MDKSGDGEVTKLNVEEEEEEERVVLCGKNDGKGWRCKKQAEKGKAFCNHHLEQLRNYDIAQKKKKKKMLKTEKCEELEMQEEEDVEERVVLCKKRNGNWWKCKKQAAKGKMLCEHHLEQLRNHQITRKMNMMKKKKMKTEKETERGDQVGGRVRARKAALDSNLYDYYYYSGFGPSWGKKRGNTNTNTINNHEFVAQEEEEEGSIFSPSSSSEMCEIDELGYSKRDDAEIGKKRGGSPITNLEEDGEKKVLCRRTSGRGWKCHEVAARGKLLCKHHLEQKRNYHSKKKKMMKKNGTPDWGKNIAVDTKSDQVFADYEALCISPPECDISEIDRIRIDYAEDDDED